MADNTEPSVDSDAPPLTGVSDLADAYTRLSAAGDPQRRGKDFEHLLQRAFQLAHFEVELDPRIAHPRQTDLSARYGDRRYLLEAKWQAAKADMDVLDGLRARLRRTSTDVVGVLVSISGFTRTVMEEIRRERQQPILLVDQHELLVALREPATLPGLLRVKHEALITHGKVHLGEPMPGRRAARRPDGALPARDLHLRDTHGEPHPYLTVPGGFTPVVFATAVTDVDWSFGRGRGVCMDIPIQSRTTDDLRHLIHGLDELGLASARPTWTLQQNDTSWFGIGAGELLLALDNAQQRVADLAAPHHSEQLVYCDTALGGLYTLTAVIAAAEPPPAQPPGESSALDSQSEALDPLLVRQCQLSIQLPGTPLDATALRHLHERFGATHSVYFRHLDSTATKISWLDQQPVEPLATIVEREPITGQDFVVGLVAQDHYSVDGKHAVLEGWPLELQGSGFMVCALADHHPVNRPPKNYWLDGVRTAHTSDAAVTTIRAGW
ncbi:restriction endonuclease [Streptomyces sp. NBC_00687]|uniref:restriction endonuclease n=1 Tax=Streptomyces sp. NBC_00687 TaxID=2975807 RepID=UPI00224D7938|nr:restriction endonuclease [Streptomyces sp. NBC_00687]MCX4920212.1 restriction endonuclease [Streptomyces sp. NBC_00687]